MYECYFSKSAETLPFDSHRQIICHVCVHRSICQTGSTSSSLQFKIFFPHFPACTLYFVQCTYALTLFTGLKTIGKIKATWESTGSYLCLGWLGEGAERAPTSTRLGRFCPHDHRRSKDMLEY